jgi:hypothetical protein
VAIKKKPIQNKINQEIKKVNKDFKVFTELDFKLNENATKLQYMFSDDYIKECSSLADKMKEYQEHNQTVPNELITQFTNMYLELNDKKTNLINKITNKHSVCNDNFYDETAEFFGLPIDGLSNNKLIHKINDFIYFKVLNQNIDFPDEKQKYDKEIEFYTLSIKEWIIYCKQLSTYKQYIEKVQPRWTKMLRSEKTTYINSLKVLLDAPFITNKKELINFIEFLESYSLNQITKAKIDKLLSYDFKNIDTYSIAKEIYQKTNLFHKNLELKKIEFGSL